MVRRAAPQDPPTAPDVLAGAGADLGEDRRQVAVGPARQGPPPGGLVGAGSRPQQDDGVAYPDADVAELYDLLNPWGPSDEFYLSLAMEARSVLDVGCGTGTLLRRARAGGHGGRLVGVDPDRAVLDVARRCSDVEWLEGVAASIPWRREFDLAVMAGHAFQCLLTDEDLRASLAAVHGALVPGGRFVFETRNPAARAWERWASGDPIDVVDPAGRALRIAYEVLAVEGDVVTIVETTSGADDGRVLRVDQGRLRFLGAEALAQFLGGAGFVVEAQHGGWSREALEAGSPEIVTSARAA